MFFFCKKPIFKASLIKNKKKIFGKWILPEFMTSDTFKIVKKMGNGV